MVNQLKSLRPYQIALTISVALGAIAGVACGYDIADWTWGGPGPWIIKRSDDAVGWATFGAIVAGMVVYGASDPATAVGSLNGRCSAPETEGSDSAATA
jgi:hypothetical protein